MTSDVAATDDAATPSRAALEEQRDETVHSSQAKVTVVVGGNVRQRLQGQAQGQAAETAPLPEPETPRAQEEGAEGTTEGVPPVQQ